jgi:hypothetical protein
MCFWFGLEILRLVYKKVFFEVAPPLIKVEKKISSKLGVQGIKRSGILRWKKFVTEKPNF